MYRIALLVFCLGSGFIIAEYRYLHGRRESQTVAWANERVADRLATARAHLDARHWNEAIHHLEDALTIENATNREEVHALLAQVRRSQADDLLDAAELAVQRKDVAAAFRLLRAYLAHPHAARLDRGRRLHDDLERATSDAHADRVLARLSDDALKRFEQNGQLNAKEGMTTAGARAIFRDTLRHRLPEELRRRQAKREGERLAAERHAAQREKRIAELRKTPTYRALTAFIARMHKTLEERQELSHRQEAALGLLLRQLRINDPREQAKIRGNLLENEDRAELAEAVHRQRAEIKHTFRTAPEHNAADDALFDRLVDRELDDLLEAINR